MKISETKICDKIIHLIEDKKVDLELNVVKNNLKLKSYTKGQIVGLEMALHVIEEVLKIKKDVDSNF